MHLTPGPLLREGVFKTWTGKMTKKFAPRVRESMCDMSVCKGNPHNYYWQLTTVESVILKPIWVLFTDRLTGMLFTGPTAVQFGRLMCLNHALREGVKAGHIFWNDLFTREERLLSIKTVMQEPLSKNILLRDGVLPDGLLVLLYAWYPKEPFWFILQF